MGLASGSAVAMDPLVRASNSCAKIRARSKSSDNESWRGVLLGICPPRVGGRIVEYTVLAGEGAAR